MSGSKEKLYLFGDNEDNQKIYESKGDREGVIIRHPAAFGAYDMEKLAGEVKSAQNRAIVVINTGDDACNLSLCLAFSQLVAAANDEEKDLFFRYLRVSVFGDPHKDAEYEKAVAEGYGCISFVDKYQQIAMDFVEKYPFTRFMDGRHIDYPTSLLKKEASVRVFMLGFGKTNRQIFLTSVANNQFLTEGDIEPQLKQVEYFIFDKEMEQKKGYLEHSYYRFHRFLEDCKEEDYLPLPALPSKEIYFSVTDYTQSFAGIENNLALGVGGANFVVIACGDDMENIAIAKALLEKRKGWKTDCFTLFVKSRNIRKEDTDLKDEVCYFIGNERDCVFNIDEILGDRIYHMSQLRNAIYDLEYDITTGAMVTEDYVQANKVRAMKNWYTAKSQLERESSTYGCLSLRSKLQFMGLDYCSKTENDLPALTQEEYLAWYAKEDMPDFDTYKFTADGKPIACYTIEFANSRRKNLATHEHQRWNSFMLSKGIIPATIEQILGEQVERGGKLRYTNGKNYAAKRHGNLTTFEGLVEFRQIVAKRDNCDEAEKDVIKYDYQLLDDAFWLVEQSGCKIIRII